MFLENILFEKSENFKNPVLPCFGGSVAGMSSRWRLAYSLVFFGDLFASGRSNREVHSEIFAAQLATHSWVDFPVAKNTSNFFFQIFVLKCFGGLIWRLFGDSFQSRKSRVLEIQGQFFFKLSVFPSIFL